MHAMYSQHPAFSPLKSDLELGVCMQTNGPSTKATADKHRSLRPFPPRRVARTTSLVDRCASDLHYANLVLAHDK